MTHSRHVSLRVAAILAWWWGVSCAAFGQDRSSAAVASGVGNGASALEGTVVRRPQEGGVVRQTAESRPWYRGTIWALGVVLALIVVGTWALRRLLPNVQRSGGGSAVQVVATTYLSPKQSLSLVRCGHRMILVGVTAEHISPLVVMEDPAEVSVLSSLAGRGGEPTRGFGESLDEAAAQFRNVTASWDEPGGPEPGHLGRAGHELRGLLAKVRRYAGGQAAG
jgi:flagellar biosynthetic protein FliO